MSNKNRILNNIIKVLCLIIIFVLLLYFGLWIYVTKSTPKELRLYYDQINIHDMPDNKYQIIWFTITGNKNYGFKWYPFVIDRIFGERNNDIKKYVAFNIINTNEKYKKGYRMETWNIEYGLSRYIRSDNDYKKCLNYIINYGYIGNNISGIINASEYYYNKNINNLTDRELISLVLLFNSRRYIIGSDYSENKIDEIVNLYYK